MTSNTRETTLFRSLRARRASVLTVCCLQLSAACADDSSKPRTPAAPQAGGGANGEGAAGGSSTTGASNGSGGADPASLRVEFEEISLDGEPAHFTDFVFYPGSDSDFLALDKGGRLVRYSLSGQSATLVSQARMAGAYDVLDCGAMSLAFEPDFEQGAYLYVGTCVSQTHSEILRLDLDQDLNVVQGSEVSILRVGHDLASRPWHNVGSIGFEPGGVLWALFGDKVRGAPSQDTAQNLGKVLRIVPSRTPGLGSYMPAPDNPLIDDATASPEVYALGLRSPFRGARDSRGRYWFGDVGSDFFEEINVVRSPLDNFGWPTFEGPCESCKGTIPPAFYWARGTEPDYIADDPQVETTLARVAWVGPEVLAHEPDRYGGKLDGSMLFGDYCAGFVRHGRVDDDGLPTLDAPLGHLNNASSFRQHSDGFVYAVTFGRCQTDVDNRADEALSRLYRMVPVE